MAAKITRDELVRVCEYLFQVKVLTRFWIGHILQAWDDGCDGEDKDPTPEEYSEAWKAAQDAGQLVIRFVDPSPPPCPDCGGGEGLACKCATGEG